MDSGFGSDFTTELVADVPVLVVVAADFGDVSFAWESLRRKEPSGLLVAGLAEGVELDVELGVEEEIVAGAMGTEGVDFGAVDRARAARAAAAAAIAELVKLALDVFAVFAVFGEVDVCCVIDAVFAGFVPADDAVVELPTRVAADLGDSDGWEGLEDVEDSGVSGSTSYVVQAL